MSIFWVSDISKMHDHFGTNIAVEKLSKENLKEFLNFRIKFLEEELKELKDATTSDDAIDALIDLVVVAIGTLDSFNVDSYTAWNEVLKANMAKRVGIKSTRPNPLGLPDLIKPGGWEAPSHSTQLTLFDKIFKE